MKISDQPHKTPDPLGLAVGSRPPAGPGGATKPHLGGSTPTDPGAAGQAGAPAAKVELSARSRELHEALRAANAAPDVRPEAVAEARTRIANGTYRVDPERIARGILDTKA